MRPFVDRIVQIQRSAKFETMGCTKAYCPLARYFVSGSRCAVISTKKKRNGYLVIPFLVDPEGHDPTTFGL